MLHIKGELTGAKLVFILSCSSYVSIICFLVCFYFISSKVQQSLHFIVYISLFWLLINLNYYKRCSKFGGMYCSIVAELDIAYRCQFIYKRVGIKWIFLCSYYYHVLNSIHWTLVNKLYLFILSPYCNVKYILRMIIFYFRYPILFHFLFTYRKFSLSCRKFIIKTWSL